MINTYEPFAQLLDCAKSRITKEFLLRTFDELDGWHQWHADYVGRDRALAYWRDSWGECRLRAIGDRDYHQADYAELMYLIETFKSTFASYLMMKLRQGEITGPPFTFVEYTMLKNISTLDKQYNRVRSKLRNTEWRDF